MRKPKPFSFIYCPIGKKANNLSAKKMSKWYFMERRNSCSMNSTGERAWGCLLTLTLLQLTQQHRLTILSARDTWRIRNTLKQNVRGNTEVSHAMQEENIIACLKWRSSVAQSHNAYSPIVPQAGGELGSDICLLALNVPPPPSSQWHSQMAWPGPTALTLTAVWQHPSTRFDLVSACSLTLVPVQPTFFRFGNSGVTATRHLTWKTPSGVLFAL